MARRISGEELVEALEKVGFKVLSERGGHIILRKGTKKIIVPDHGVLEEDILKAILSQTKIKLEELPLKVKKEPEEVVEEPLEDMEPVPAAGGGSMGFFGTAFENRGRLWPLGIYRIMIGLLFLLSAFSKAPWLENYGWFTLAVQNAIKYPTLELWKGLFLYVIQPNIGLFAWLQFIIELFLGLALLAGLFTVLFSFLGQFWVLTIWLTVASWPSEWSWSYIMLFMAMFLFWTTKAGRSLGVDQKLSERAVSFSQHSKLWKLVGWLT